MTYLITFTCYGSHLHGAETGSVDWEHRAHGSPRLDIDSAREESDVALMDQPAYSLDQTRRSAVLQSIRQTCQYRGWRLLAAHVRSSHVHVVVAAAVPPEAVMNQLKSYASRRLNGMGVDPPGRKRWTRHGSTVWLWKPVQISAAIQYVVDDQGSPMAVFADEA